MAGSFEGGEGVGGLERDFCAGLDAVRGNADVFTLKQSEHCKNRASLTNVQTEQGQLMFFFPEEARKKVEINLNYTFCWFIDI